MGTTRHGGDAQGIPELEIIEGRNAVLEALRAKVPIDKVYIMRGDTDGTLRHIASIARAEGLAVVDADKRKLDAMSVTHSHQGIIAQMSCVEYASINDIMENARKQNAAPLVVICDEIMDPHNLGAIIRTCESAGAHGVIIPKRRSAGLTPIVAKASAGAVFHLPVARVTNISSTIAHLKESGIWVYGASAGGKTPLWECELTGPAAIVIGSEGKGIKRLVENNCDVSISIPMYGRISSLNASVSAAIILYEAARQRDSRYNSRPAGEGM